MGEYEQKVDRKGKIIKEVNVDDVTGSEPILGGGTPGIVEMMSDLFRKRNKKKKDD